MEILQLLESLKMMFLSLCGRTNKLLTKAQQLMDINLEEIAEKIGKMIIYKL